MQRVDNSSASTTLPPPKAPGTAGYFTEGDTLVGTEPTIVDQDWMNSVQEELCNVISAAAITLDKTNRAQLLAALNRLFLPKILVTSALTLYVSTTGNDANNGLSAGSAFLTLQAAVNAVYGKYNFNGFGCTIQVGDGTYTTSVAGGSNCQIVGRPTGMPEGGLTILGNPGNPDAVQVTATNGTGFTVIAMTCTINGVSFTGTGTSWTVISTSGVGLAVARAGWVTLANWRAKNCGMFPIRADTGSTVIIQGTNNKLVGSGGQYGMFAGEGAMIWSPGATLDVTGFGSVQANFMCDQGRFELAAMSFIGAGSCTGPRYASYNCGVIITGGGGANYLPGNAAGGVLNGGIYT